MYELPLSFHGRVIKIALIGVGGSGSAIAQELMQLDTTLRALDSASGLSVEVFDGTVVTNANICRQAYFPTQVGSNKAQATVWTANNLHGKQWVAHPRHFEVGKDNLSEFDVVITAVDKPSVRYNISQLPPRKTVLWLDMGNDATQCQIVLGELASRKYLPHICDLYDYEHLSDDDGLEKSCSAEESIRKQELGVNQFAARVGAQLLWNLFRHGKIDTHGAYVDVKTLQVDPLVIDEQTWEIYGYKPQK